ncbi:DUF937 domain-containing protein [Thermocoleostomius sinensis]|jgi:hypothetical protein|uniref:DUF937 domain-containing protein n=1 Tax=Thermocoleostomius sinensis A174 TaxID=2016057 RepID=A0A9E9C2V7_9CYAN|nr:DUF937 domain-containing protein [Thermocoleostomius sinensis]WAL58306.1 DUF937 domain-containing protein [Thermocoleostomius sinensis A174]
MGLFFDLLSAINNPSQQATVSQLETITNSIDRVTTAQGFDASKTQSLLSALGNAMRPALAQQQDKLGNRQLEDLLARAGTNTNATAFQAIFPPQLQQQIAQGVSQRTGVSPNILQGILPTLIPSVLGLLNMGANKPGSIGGNPLLSSFLAGDRRGNTDLGDVFKFAHRFLNGSPAR